MPVYDYKCARHGLFNQLATMAQSAEPAPCPSCGELSPRVILLSPQILAMSPARREAMARNEKAAHEPGIYTPETREEMRERARHGKGCGCHGEADRSSLRQKAILLADGSKIFPSQRPWMISH